MHATKIAYTVLFFYMFTCPFYAYSNHNSRLLLIDTAYNPKHNAETLMALADQAGFATDYVHFDAVTKALVKKYDALFLLLDSSFLNNQTQSTVKKCLAACQDFARAHNKLIGILLPNDIRYDQEAHALIKAFLKKIARHDYDDRALEEILSHLLAPIHKHSTWYNTALYHTTDKTPSKKALSTSWLQLPMEHSSAITDHITPLGFFDKSSSLFLSNMVFFSCFEKAEECRLMPLDRALRISLLNNVAATLRQLRQLYAEGDADDETTDLPRLCTDQFSRQEHERIQKVRTARADHRYAWATQGPIVAGWMDIEPYIKDATTLQEGIESIFNARLNLLWLIISPELYLSKNAYKAEEKEQWLQNISDFTAALRDYYQKKLQKPPHIFVNFSITSNFFKKPVTESVIDFYGTNYDKIPAPLDRKNLWHPEVIEVLDAFITAWERHCGNGLPIDGIFFDLEMYHAQSQMSQYSNLVDFSDSSWMIYAQQSTDQNITTIHSHKKRISYLTKHQKMHDYFNALTQEARMIGQEIRTHIHTKLPHATIGVYTITLPATWFLEGFLAGLSSPELPIIWATFNTDAFSHAQWLEKHTIYYFHLGVLMLSKLQTPSDFMVIDQVLPYHDGIWINKFSRLMESRNKNEWAWDFELETTPLATDSVTHAIASRVAHHSTHTTQDIEY